MYIVVYYTCMHVQCSHYIDLDPYNYNLYISQFPRGALFIGSWVNIYSVLDIYSCISETTQYIYCPIYISVLGPNYSYIYTILHVHTHLKFLLPSL